MVNIGAGALNLRKLGKRGKAAGARRRIARCAVPTRTALAIPLWRINALKTDAGGAAVEGIAVNDADRWAGKGVSRIGAEDRGAIACVVFGAIMGAVAGLITGLITGPITGSIIGGSATVGCDPKRDDAKQLEG